MRQLQWSAVALFWLTSAAYAQSANPGGTALWPNNDPRAYIIVQSGSGRFHHVVRNANLCAPDQAEAVWGYHQELLGYRCYENPNGK